MPDLIEPIFYLAAIPAILIAGVSKGGFGGGLGVVSVPILSLVMPVNIAAAIMLPILCFMDLFGLWAYRFKWDKSYLIILIPAAFVGILIGTFSFEFLHEAWVRLITGCIAIIFSTKYFVEKYVVKQTKPKTIPTNKNTKIGYFWGVIAGFTSFVAHAGGPPISAYLLSQNLDKTKYQATSVFLFTFVNYVKLLPYALIGQFNAEVLTVSLYFLPLAPIGMIVGIKLHKLISPIVFYLVCYTFLFITGIKLISDWIRYIL